MSFMGELKDVGIAELLSVMARRHLTGKLTINIGSEEVIVLLDQGKVTQVTSSNQNLRLGRVLVRLGTVTEVDLREAIRAQTESAYSRPLGQILLDQGLVTDSELAAAAQEQATDVLSRVFGTHDGAFFYTGLAAEYVRPGLMALNAEGVVLEASRRADEIEAIRQMLPGLDAPLTLNRESLPIGNSLPDMEQRITRVLGAEHLTIAGLLGQLAEDERAILRALVRLLERGIVSTGDEGTQTARTAHIEMTVAPRTADEIKALVSGGVGAGRREWVPGLAEVRKASPAGSHTIAKATRVVREAMGAFNAGLPFLAFAHFTDSYFRRLSPTAIDELDTLDAGNGPLAEELRQTFIDLTDVRRLSDGRVSAILVTSLPDDAPSRKVVIFTEDDDRCLIDAIIDPGKDRARETQTTLLSPTGLLERDRRVIRQFL
jgi:hypothetical protein